MGGAQRSARKRRQQSAGARAVTQARGGGGPSRKMVVAVVAVVVLAAVIIGGVIWTNSSKNSTAGQAITPQTVAGLDNPSERQGATVVSGSPNAKVKLTIYADFLCPYCGQLQTNYGTQMEQQIQAGTLQVTYQMIPLLNDRSDPPGYSLDSANAALCAADQGKFTSFHDSLYKSQPEEGQRGYDNSQLIKLGNDLGITSPNFATCVNNGTYKAQINADYQKIASDPSFQGTPTILHNNQQVNWTDPNWLNNLLNAA